MNIFLKATDSIEAMSTQIVSAGLVTDATLAVSHLGLFVLFPMTSLGQEIKRHAAFSQETSWNASRPDTGYKSPLSCEDGTLLSCYMEVYRMQQGI